jgi:hypothetical protein
VKLVTYCIFYFVQQYYDFGMSHSSICLTPCKSYYCTTERTHPSTSFAPIVWQAMMNASLTSNSLLTTKQTALFICITHQTLFANSAAFAIKIHKN